MYILGAFDGLLKQNKLKKLAMSSSKTACLCFVTSFCNHDTEQYN
jgi:hypothetical protein